MRELPLICTVADGFTVSFEEMVRVPETVPVVLPGARLTCAGKQESGLTISGYPEVGVATVILVLEELMALICRSALPVLQMLTGAVAVVPEQAVRETGPGT